MFMLNTYLLIKRVLKSNMDLIKPIIKIIIMDMMWLSPNVNSVQIGT